MPHRTLDALSKKYGPLFRLRLRSIEVVVAASAEVAFEFLRSHDAIFFDRPPNSGTEHVAYNYQDLVFAPYGPSWRALHKLGSLHLFNAKALDDLRGIRKGEVGDKESGDERQEGVSSERRLVLGYALKANV